MVVDYTDAIGVARFRRADFLRAKFRDRAIHLHPVLVVRMTADVHVGIRTAGVHAGKARTGTSAHANAGLKAGAPSIRIAQRFELFDHVFIRSCIHTPSL